MLKVGDKVKINQEKVEKIILDTIDNTAGVITDWDESYFEIVEIDLEDEYSYKIELNGKLGFSEKELIKVEVE